MLYMPLLGVTWPASEPAIAIGHSGPLRPAIAAYQPCPPTWGVAILARQSESIVRLINDEDEVLKAVTEKIVLHSNSDEVAENFAPVRLARLEQTRTTRARISLQH